MSTNWQGLYLAEMTSLALTILQTLLWPTIVGMKKRLFLHVGRERILDESDHKNKRGAEATCSTVLSRREHKDNYLAEEHIVEIV